MDVIYNKNNAKIIQVILSAEPSLTLSQLGLSSDDYAIWSTTDDSVLKEDVEEKDEVWVVNDTVSPSSYSEIVQTQLELIDPVDDSGNSWTSGVQGIVNPDAGVGAELQTFKIQGIHADLSVVEIYITNIAWQWSYKITANEGDDNSDVVWNVGDDFLYVKCLIGNTETFGTWGIKAYGGIYSKSFDIPALFIAKSGVVKPNFNGGDINFDVKPKKLIKI